MKLGKGKVARVKNGYPHFAECEIKIESLASNLEIIFACDGEGWSGQGYLESVPERGYDDWKLGAKMGIEFALSIAGESNYRVTVTAIRGMETDTNPSIVAYAAARSVWHGIDFSPDREIIDRIENRVFNSWQNPDVRFTGLI